MRQVRAVVVGSLVMDLSFRVPKRPEPGEVVIAETFGAYRGGKGYNQAVALARLGAEVTMIGAVGDDAYGNEFIESLRAEGIDAARMVRALDSHTAVAVPLVTPDGDVGFVHSPGANQMLMPEHCHDIPECDILMLQGEIPTETSIRAATIARQNGARIFLNPAPVHDITPELIALSDLICPNEVEARALLQIRPGQAVDPVAIAQQLSQRSDVAVVTLGERGAAWSDGTNWGLTEPPRITAVDATGAGDSFCAGLAIALIEGQPLSSAVRFACAAGAYAATVRGAEPGLPTRAEVEALLHR